MIQNVLGGRGLWTVWRQMRGSLSLSRRASRLLPDPWKTRVKIKPPPSHCWHWWEETLEEGLQSIWWRKTSTCKGNTLNWRKCWNVATTPLGCVHQMKIIKVTPKGVPRKYRSFVGNDVFCFCGQGDYGEMIACDSPICPVEWFHLDCLGLSCAPEGEWFWQTMSF